MSSLGYQNQYVFYMLKMCVCVDNYIIMIKNRLFQMATADRFILIVISQEPKYCVLKGRNCNKHLCKSHERSSSCDSTHLATFYCLDGERNICTYVSIFYWQLCRMWYIADAFNEVFYYFRFFKMSTWTIFGLYPGSPASGKTSAHRLLQSDKRKIAFLDILHMVNYTAKTDSFRYILPLYPLFQSNNLYIN